ncbi:MAG: hypothetical protein V4735_05310 [Pseudomonadota bacterium]
MRAEKTQEELLKAQCQSAADMVVDALVMAGILDNRNAMKASEIAAEEILVRKAMGKL